MAEIQWIQNGRSKSLDLSPSCDYGIYGSDNPLSNAQHHELTQSSRVYLLPLIAETTTVVRRCLCVCVCVCEEGGDEKEIQFINSSLTTTKEFILTGTTNKASRTIREHSW